MVSFGPAGCGAGYESNRGVYTNTTHYLDTFIKQYASSVQTNAYSGDSTLNGERSSMASRVGIVYGGWYCCLLVVMMMTIMYGYRW